MVVTNSSADKILQEHSLNLGEPEKKRPSYQAKRGKAKGSMGTQ